jgi:threonine dehydratase
MTEWPIPDLSDVLSARLRIEPHLRPTPLFTYPALDRLVGASLHVKHENHQPVGAFKVRGGVNLVAQLSNEERERGLSPPPPATTVNPSPSPRDDSA